MFWLLYTYAAVFFLLTNVFIYLFRLTIFLKAILKPYVAQTNGLVILPGD